MSEPLPPRENLAEWLHVEPRGEAAVARLESFWGATTRGDLLARATLAAGVAPTLCHALFFREVAPDVELAFTKHALAAGALRVEVREGAALVATVALRTEPQVGAFGARAESPEPGLPAPEGLPSEAELGAREGWAAYAVGPIESRRVTPYEPVKEDEPAVWLGWLRPRAPLARDPLAQAAALAFLAEYRSHWAIERRLGADFPKSEIMLLDHALWVHQAAVWDDWWLARTRCDVGAGGLCLSHREIFSRAGALVASAAWTARVVTP